MVKGHFLELSHTNVQSMLVPENCILESANSREETSIVIRQERGRCGVIFSSEAAIARRGRQFGRTRTGPEPYRRGIHN